MNMAPVRIAAIAVLALRAAYGAALVAAPGRVTKQWLGPAATRPPAVVGVRGLGAREVAVHVAAIVGALRGAPLRPWLAVSVAGDLSDIADHRGEPRRPARQGGREDARGRRRLGRDQRRARRRRGPRHVTTASRDVVRLAHVRRGSGPPLVLLHALGADNFMWDPVMERLAAERDVIAVDMPGFGALAAAGRRLAGVAGARGQRVRGGGRARASAPGRQLAGRLGGAGDGARGRRRLGDRDRPRRSVAEAARAQAERGARGRPPAPAGACRCYSAPRAVAGSPSRAAPPTPSGSRPRPRSGSSAATRSRQASTTPTPRCAPAASPASTRSPSRSRSPGRSTTGSSAGPSACRRARAA